jgi:MerR family redox-sensitive transcriptional activator SoxR
MLKVKVSFKSRLFVGTGFRGGPAPGEVRTMKIGELAARSGLNASAIRHYEKLGLLPPPQRSSGQRRYSSEAINRALLIRFAGDMGFTLAEIKLFLSGLRDNAPVGPRWKKLAHRKIVEVESNLQRSLRLRTLLENLLHCRCPSLEVCVQRLSLSPKVRALEKRTEPRKPGSMKGKLKVDSKFHEPLPEEELKPWE